MPINVVLLGKGELACRIGDWFVASGTHSLRWVVPVMPEPKWTQSLQQWCRSRDVSFIESGHFRDIPCVEAENWSVDLIFSVFYDKVIPAWLLNKARRALNLHNGPLPRYRGMNPVNWALKNGEREHGVTIHEMTPELDAGDIVAQVKFSIFPEHDEVIDVYRRALTFGYALFEQTMPMLDRIRPRQQEDSSATYYTAADAEQLGERRNFTRATSTVAAS
ncbi:MAG: hypothetical protein J5J06_16965 [Phycisphaerae bacterium]|nr:hypothetical protein [Phycisphaerae bacterium]